MAIKENKVIGILTFLHTLNYGALLQSYALQAFLNSNGFSAIQIDYRNANVESYEFKRSKTVKNRLANIVRRPIIKKKTIEFEEFTRRFIKATPVVERGELAGICSDFDCIVVGSDQVWNGEITDYDTTYFLDFIPDDDKKYSYAVSIGQDDFPEKKGIDYYSLLHAFSQVLVREQTAAKALGNFVEADKLHVVLDPTLLVEAEVWNSFVGESASPMSRPYVFVYAVGETKRAVEAAREMAREHGWDLVVLQQDKFLPILGAKNLFSISPADFLTYFKHASAIVTSSFHGLCMSIQFRKDFLVSYTEGIACRNSRISDLLLALECEDRVIGSPSCDCVNWELVEQRLTEKRIQSSELLLNALSQGV